jgi:hypothetical protein
MTSLARTFCTLFAVAILAAMNLHGVTQSQHAMAHVADWPAVALVDQGSDHDHHGPHVMSTSRLTSFRPVMRAAIPMETAPSATTTTVMAKAKVPCRSSAGI